MWICPHCQLALQLNPEGKSMACLNGHSFDRAREGYVNLLPSNRKRSREPGDDASMIAARHRVHEANTYQPLAEALVAQLAGLPEAARVLDLGCGEGYYCGFLNRALPDSRVYGVDISRPAVRLAARQNPQVQCAVASAIQLPLPDASLDAVLRVFAPSDDAEVCRVLKAGAWYLEVSPAPGHLWQLREQLYDRPREHPQARSEILGMAPVSRQVLEYTLPLNPELLADIVAMTPFAHRGHREKREGLRRASLAELRMAFSLKLFQRAQ